MFGLGFGELLIIFLIALVFIGPKKLPELARGLGQGIKEFQKGVKGLADQLESETSLEEKKNDTQTPQVAQTSPEEEKVEVEKVEEEKPHYESEEDKPENAS